MFIFNAFVACIRVIQVNSSKLANFGLDFRNRMNEGKCELKTAKHAVCEDHLEMPPSVHDKARLHLN